MVMIGGDVRKGSKMLEVRVAVLLRGRSKGSWGIMIMVEFNYFWRVVRASESCNFYMDA
jgi:hypothetical protein